MAFLSRVSNILKQSARQQSSELFASRPSICQAVRCMSSKLFVGGISYNTDETSLREAFSKYGEVVEARVIMDRETGRSRGFGFVTFTSNEEASSAIQALDGQDLHGRQVRVNYATERTARGPPSSGYGAGGGSYGSGGNYGRRENYNSNYVGNSFGSGGYGIGGGGYGGDGGQNSAGDGYKAGDFSVAGGGGGSSSFADSGIDGNSGFGFGGSADEFGSNERMHINDPLEGNYKDDERFDDYAKRA